MELINVFIYILYFPNINKNYYKVYKDKINIENKNVKFIKQNQIFRCITRSSLLVTDFSSIIFEFIYQKKPYIMFIPDSEDLNIEQYYISNY
jgi:CDP-glycerol glycerophosphotransferase (TagB/SpsB family)